MDTKVLYMVGDATSAGWSAENPVTMTKAGNHLFTFEGELKVGELKFTPNKRRLQWFKALVLWLRKAVLSSIEHGASVADIVMEVKTKAHPITSGR